MKIVNSLFAFLLASSSLYAQEPLAPPIKRVVRCQTCAQRVIKPSASLSRIPELPPADAFYVGEARVEVTKDETVVRLAMAQHGSVLIELPANDGPRYLIPGDPEMATVDQKALEHNKRAIVVRPGTLFVPPLGNAKTRRPAATLTAQMRSGLVVTFLFYPVLDLAQNVHRCVLNYSRDEVVARRRAAGLPVNLDSTTERGQETAQPVASTTISIRNSEDANNSNRLPPDSSLPGTYSSAEVTPKPLPSTSLSTWPEPVAEKKAVALNESKQAIAATRSALERAVKEPKQFKKWTGRVHGLSLSIRQQPDSSPEFRVLVVAVRNATSDTLKLTSDSPDLFVEMLGDDGKPLTVESVKKLHTASDASGVISPGGTIYHAIAYLAPVLNLRHQLKLAVAQTNAADKPVSIELEPSQR
jgi:hypothetical protein